MDIYYLDSDENIKKLYNALFDFWGGNIPELEQADELKQPGLFLQYGIPPNRIDLLNTLDDIDFKDAWQSREIAELEINKTYIEINYIGLELLIKNKEIANRPKDLDDLKFLKPALALGREKRE